MSDEVSYLRSLKSVRERCSAVFALAEANKLEFWDLDLSKESEIVDFCAGLITRDFGTDYDSIPPHGRWRHFLSGRIEPVIDEWRSSNVDNAEIARRLVDLFVVSVLLDAGAGPNWKYTEAGSSEPIGRSEGLAIASLAMVKSGMFSGSPDSQAFRVDAKGLSGTSVQAISEAMQVSSSNTMVGIEGRARLLVNLGKVLADPANKAYFGGREQSGDPATFRPGNMVDYLRDHPSAQQIPSPSSLPISVPLEALWELLIDGLGGVWPPSRTKLDGVALGDVWQCNSLRKSVEKDSDSLVAFHKLTQWLNYSLMEVFDQILGWKFTNTSYTTGLPEYRNGGLLMDFGYLKIRPQAVLESLGRTSSDPVDALDLPPLPASHSAIVEFRAVTVIALDRIAAGINKKFGVELTLAQVLESATWKGGREVAKKKRSDGGPPINVLLDGTVF